MPALATTAIDLPPDVLDAALWRATTDVGFRSRLLADPGPALAECGLSAAWAIGPIRVVDEPAQDGAAEGDGDAREAPAWGSITLVLPPLLEPGAELSAGELGLPGTIEPAADWCITSCGLSLAICGLSAIIEPPQCTDGPTYCSVQ